MADTDIFSSDPIESTSTEITIADMVGEDKKYKTPDDVAKAYYHVEGHAKQVERENADLRARLDALEANRQEPTPQKQEPGQDRDDDNRQEPRKDSNSRVDTDDFRSRIREEVKALNETERAQANAESAAQKMVEVYGDPAKANEAVRRRAQELGVSVEWLRDSAAKSPTAFFATMGLNGQAGTRETPAPHSEVNLGRGGEKPKNFEYYDQIRKDNPKLYFSATMQREMQSQAKAQGSDFYKR